MRIGMMVDMYKPHTSGITTYVSLNKRTLEALGHTVFVFTVGDGDYEDDELRIVRSPGLPLNIHDTGFHFSFRYSRAAQSKVRTMDVLHVHHPFLSGPLALRYARSRGIPVIYTNHTRLDLYLHHYVPAYIPEAVGQTFLHSYLPNFCAQCDLVIAPSAGIERVLRDLGVTANVRIIPNGVDLAPFQQVSDPLTRAEVGLPSDAVVLMYLGRLSPEKGLPMLMRSFFGVAAARMGVVLALVGDGPEADNLRDQAERAGLANQVLFLGKVDYARVPAYLRLADVFVTASQTEVHPLSLIEAMAAGLPALGIDSPGIGDTIVDGENGFLSAPDIAVFTAKLMRLVMEPDLRRHMADRARELAAQYDINRTARLVLAEYENLAAVGEQRTQSGSGYRQRPKNSLP